MPVDYDAFRTKPWGERIRLFNDISAEEKAELVRTHISRWVDAHRQSLTTAQVEVLEEWMAFIQPPLYVEPRNETSSVRREALEARTAALFSREEMMEALTMHWDRALAIASVIGVSASSTHSFSKTPQLFIRLLEGLGVDGDAHQGVTVRHRSRVARDPSQPNLRQVHLIHGEILEELRTAGFNVRPGDLGENVTTSGIDLLSLPRGTRLRLGSDAVVEITGLRNPCSQLDRFQNGLMVAVLARDEAGNLVRKAGVMAIVIAGGIVRVSDPIVADLPAMPHEPLGVV
jgi:hypothetical protein